MCVWHTIPLRSNPVKLPGFASELVVLAAAREPAREPGREPGARAAAAARLPRRPSLPSRRRRPSRPSVARAGVLVRPGIRARAGLSGPERPMRTWIQRRAQAHETREDAFPVIHVMQSCACVAI